MKNFFLNFILLLSVFGYSQGNQLWTGYYSYNSIKDVSQGENQIYAAAENAYFKKNTTTNEIITTSTIEGLSGENISQIYHSPTFKKTLIGHGDGLLIVVNDVDGTMLNVVDIRNKPSVPPNKKKINHFMEKDGKVYVSTDFGICVYDLNTLEFGDTYFIGSGGSNIEILQTTINNGFIYAVANAYGLLKASVANPNLIDYQQWTMAASGNWLAIEKAGPELIGVGLNGAFYRFSGDTPNLISTFSQIPVDVRYNNGYLAITTQDFIYIYNDQLVEVLRINGIPTVNPKFTCATVINNTIYIGTQENGLYSTTFSNPTVFLDNTPNGPVRNKIFAVKATSNSLWTVYGDYTSQYNPYPLDFYPISKFDKDKIWKSIPYSDLLGAQSISRIIITPNNENQIYFSSYIRGLLKLENETPTILYNYTNSTIQNTLTPTGQQVVGDNRINGSAFDKNGNLWITNSLTNKPLHSLKPNGQWQSHSIGLVLEPANCSYGPLAIDKNGTKWISSTRYGVIGFNESYNNRNISITEGPDKGNLPTFNVRVATVDQKNKLWIGTMKGLRILANVDSFLSQDNLTTNPIIIMEDGLAQELLYQQFITDIVVDGANNKWIGTAGAGVFFISDDGQKTYHIFTKENSPLPNNTIKDIEINEVTGEVFIVTDSGMVSYRGTSTKGAENLENIIAFPNPVRPEFDGSVAITGLMDKCNVKITDIEGNLVYEEISQGGTVMWDTKVFGKKKVASGVYMVFVSSDDGVETKVKKVMVIR